ncbi:Eco57I restriction-modification methylase domain-containing protein [Bifidobacterium leontopitheci]|uniref:site-specific DNA-methyltransferase (adenine-specific) n=1 Tax=Bifidobacterium leontopitheci TaxID=2650774 RepID=A0A6I1GU88_9BIFI|nr:DNA methyltransferase [Bifidobacterium leontopitheci]KAB7790041.1 hypothetical protein F7D09_1461 [Bifidobacterium leontopitheci]
MAATRHTFTHAGRSARQMTAAQMHRDWLQLVMADGPFLAVPPLKKAWPQGMHSIRQRPNGSAVLKELKDRKAKFEQTWDEWYRSLVNDDSSVREHYLNRYRKQRDAWAQFVLRDMLEWEQAYAPLTAGSADAAVYRVMSPNEAVSVEPTGMMRLGDRIGALVLTVDPVEGDLADDPGDGWSANALDRMENMLRVEDSTCSIGVVTDGRWWAIVSAPKNGSAAWGQFDSQMWIDTPAVRDAFAELLDVRHLLTGAEENRLPHLFAESVTAAEEVTDTLGRQVRQAVELVIAAFSEASARAREDGLADPLPEDGEEIYEATVTVMMRVVFLLFAQERGLLPQGRLFESGYGLAGVLDELDARAREDGEESMDGTGMVWHRLLATSQALYYGASFEDMRLPAYGGSVFDPERHPFLTALNEHGELALSVPDRVMYHVLRAVQIANVNGEARRISFRDIDVEQIGYIYEGLLGYTCRRSDDTVLGLNGTIGSEPEIPLATLEQLTAGLEASDPKGSKRAAAIGAWVKGNATASKAPSISAMAKMIAGKEPEDGERALLSVSHDTTVQDRLRPWLGLIRRDLRGKPVVFLKGDLYVTETPSRKNAGAHYTPKTLAEDVVRYALEPLVYKPGPYQTNDRDKWRPISSDDLLDLHVADIACGSGAFLVAAGRYLADRLVEAWHREGTMPGGTSEQVRNKAMRQVVAKCLYGADINEMAVEMCKLSLWLVSLDPHLPFSFVDNKIFHGNSLLGVTSLAQVKTMRIDAKPQHAQGSLFLDIAGGDMVEAVDVDGILRKVRRLRDQLSDEINNDDPQRSANAKRRQMRAIADALTQVRLIADGVIAAGLQVGGKPGKQLDEAYDNLAVAAGRAFPHDGADGDDTMLRGIITRGLTPTVPTDYEQWQCLHWPLEIPEVMENGGFDAIIGNPPFLGGQKLTGAMGDNMRDWYVNVIANGQSGSADLCAYFYLRALDLLRKDGTFGLLATNTIAQGKTREVGLDQMIERGFTITRAIQSQSWTVASANVEYAVVWGVNGRVGDSILKDCDGVMVKRISTLLEPTGKTSTPPQSLIENISIAFQGCIVLGQGFIILPETAQQWIVANPKNKDVLFPYLNGDNLNKNPDCSASRWVIDFTGRNEKQASEYVLPYEHVVENVKQERLAKKDPTTSGAPWWLFLRTRPEMRRTISPLDRVIVIAQVSRTLMPQMVSNDQVFDAKLIVFATNRYSDLAVLSSAMHRDWVIKYGTTMRTDPTYTPSAVFATFPRPTTGLNDLAVIGETLYTERREIMLRSNLGLTDLYNLVNDPDSSEADVARLREIHKTLDETVMAAYGWDDVPLKHGFHTYRKMTRWTVCPEARVEILDRLLEENHRRYALEQEGK